MTESTTEGKDIRILATRLWHRLRRPLTRWRAPYMWLSRRRTSRANLLVRADSVLAIEAPMRSANTYGRSGHVARHMHTPAHVLEAIRLDVPTLVIVREPTALAISHVIRRPALTVRDSLIDYAEFFETLDTVRSDLVVATFEEVTHSFDVVIKRINDRYGTVFNAPHVDALFDQKVKDIPAVIQVVLTGDRVHLGYAVDVHQLLGDLVDPVSTHLEQHDGVDHGGYLPRPS